MKRSMTLMWPCIDHWVYLVQQQQGSDETGGSLPIRKQCTEHTDWSTGQEEIPIFLLLSWQLLSRSMMGYSELFKLICYTVGYSIYQIITYPRQLTKKNQALYWHFFLNNLIVISITKTEQWIFFNAYNCFESMKEEKFITVTVVGKNEPTYAVLVQNWFKIK